MKRPGALLLDGMDWPLYSACLPVYISAEALIRVFVVVNRRDAVLFNLHKARSLKALIDLE